MSTFLSKSLQTLWDQVKVAYPGRATDSDGWVASDAHHKQNPSSDHEPDEGGIVRALDLTHDPAHGFDSYKFADWLLNHRDSRIKYVISNRRIGGDEGYAKRNNRKPWTWYKYNGSNPHEHHVHISCNKFNEDDMTNWVLPTGDDTGFVVKGSGKGSWYSQFEGQYKWVDQGDASGSNALGVPDNQQGFAMYNKATLGKWRDVQAPNGVILRLQQTDIGPHPTTGRSIDIAAVAAEHFGYSPKNFPTDSIFKWSDFVNPNEKPPSRDDTGLIKVSKTFDPRVVEIQKLLGFSTSEQDGYFGTDTERATKWFQRRNGLEVDGVIGEKTLSLLRTSDASEAQKVIEAVITTLMPYLEKNYAVLTNEQLAELIIAMKENQK